jgi:hypothetical protein
VTLFELLATPLSNVTLHSNNLEKDRKCTDIVCTIIAGCFALTLFIAALAMMNKGITLFIQLR